MVSKTQALTKRHAESDHACSIKAVFTFTIGVFIALSRLANAADLTIDINTSASLRTIPDTLYGTNLTAWDGTQNGSNSTFNNLMIASGMKYMRWPGGSWGDAYLWSDMEGPNGANTWIVSYNETLYLLGIIDATLQPIVNFPGYWFGQDHNDADAVAAAVAWVEDQSSRTPCAQYWEIGNEIGGSWEAGWFEGISGTYYGEQFAQFYLAMKAVNPAIKIGACAEPYSELKPWFYAGYWTHDLLEAADVNWSVVPDFLIIHSYPGTGQNASYNPTLLGDKVDEIEDFTESLNTIITDTIGPEYVGQIKYWMTEWNAGGIDGTYERWRLFVSAMFQLQYTLEMAKHGWEGSNPWGNSYYWNSSEFSNFYTYPNWYIYPFLTKKFGSNMVTTSASNSIVRAYASRDDANNLTIFVINNSPDTDLTAQINIMTRLVLGAEGHYWLIEGAGTTPTGASTPLQDLQDVKINGDVHPNPLTIDSLEGVSFTSGDSFEVNLPKSSILFLSVPLSTSQAPYGGTRWTIPGTIEAEDYDVGGEEVSFHDTGVGNDGNEYRSDDVDIESCGEGGYNVTDIEDGEWLEYSVDVESTGVYQIEARVASSDSNGLFRLDLDGDDLAGQISFTPTGDDQNFSTIDINAVLLAAGRHVIRLSIDSSDWNLNGIRFTQIGSGTGKILRQYWSDVPGDSVSDLNTSDLYPAKPTGRELITDMEAPANWADSYGTRIRGFLHPIADGNYTFWIAADDSAELRLSPDIDPNNANLIACTSDSTDQYEWDKYPEQQSSTVSLSAGQKYYIEVLHKEDTNLDHVCVSWQGPDFSQQIVDGLYLSPYINIKKCTVKAGKIIGQDNITCSGDFEATLAQLAEADRVIVKIYSVAEDYQVFEQSIDFNAFSLKQNTYSYKYKPATGQPGAITSLKFDTGKKNVSLQAKNIDLTGLGCPLYMTIDAGGYCGTAVVDEPVVNGKKSIPLRLMSGYADTLAVTKVKVKDSLSTADDKLSIKGTITVADDSNVADGLTITWGGQTFTIPGEQFVQVKTGRYKCAYTNVDGAIITADFNFAKCTFSINIKLTTLTQTSGSIDFALSFGSYDHTEEIQL